MTLEGVIKCLPTLKKLMKARTSTNRRKILRSCRGGCIYYAISEISKNVLNGGVPLTEKQRKLLKRYKAQLREIKKKTITLKRRKQIINQKGGLLPSLLVPTVSFLAQILADRVMK